MAQDDPLPVPRRRRPFRELNPGRPVKALHGYLYFRWWRQYLAFMFWALAKPALLPRVLYERLGRAAMDRQHSKVIPPADARRLLSVNQEISLTNLEQVIPYSQARDVILDQPLSLAVVDCACRSAQAEHCEPLDVCIVVGEALSGFLVDRRILGARRVSVDEALGVLQREHERGRVHTAWFKDAAGQRLYCICNCCRCCCIGMRALIDYRIPVVASSGYVSEVDRDLCDTCGACFEACTFGALSVDGVCRVDADVCMGCGVCVDRCTRGALHLERHADKPVPLDLADLTPQPEGTRQ